MCAIIYYTLKIHIEYFGEYCIADITNNLILLALAWHWFIIVHSQQMACQAKIAYARIPFPNFR